MSVSGKHAVVTGGGSGVGAEIARVAFEAGLPAIAVIVHVQAFPKIPGQNVGPALFPGLVDRALGKQRLVLTEIDAPADKLALTSGVKQ